MHEVGKFEGFFEEKLWMNLPCRRIPSQYDISSGIRKFIIESLTLSGIYYQFLTLGSMAVKCLQLKIFIDLFRVIRRTVPFLGHGSVIVRFCG